MEPGGLGAGLDAGAIALEVRGLGVRFGGLHALDDVDVSVPAGRISGLIGPNGAGKTTLFNCVSGFVRPIGGTIWIAGREVTRMASSERPTLGMARTFQHAGLVREVSVLANTVMAQHRVMAGGVVASLVGGTSEEERVMAERGAEALERVGVHDLAASRVLDLPHGAHKLVELACAIVRQPRLLLLDEPSAGLDPAETSDLAERLARIQADTGFTVLVIDHDMRLVRRLAEHISVLSFGQVVARGSWDEVRNDPGVIAAYLGTTSEGRSRQRSARR